MLKSWSDRFPSCLAVFSDRTVDFSLPHSGEKPFTLEQEAWLKRNHIEPGHVMTIRQVHGAEVLPVENHLLSLTPWPEADAVMTRIPGIVLSVRTADCLPIWIYDEQTPAVALVHAGWRSTARNILGRTLRMMKKLWGTSLDRVSIALGPAARSCCYAVDRKFSLTFPRYVQEEKGAFFLDFVGVNREQARLEGVTSERIWDCGVCTMCSAATCFSYRREGRAAGRHIALLGLKAGRPSGSC